MSDKTLIDFLPEIVKLIEKQLKEDQERWGDTWKHRPIEGQEARTFARLRDYYDQYLFAGISIPWEKVIGGAIICMVREMHPEELVEDE
jgi:hypothetical protein